MTDATNSTDNSMMKAVLVHAYGGPEALTLEDIPRPVPKANEVLVRVSAAGVNPVDWKLREGHLQQIMPVQFPFTPGCDVAGIVESVGEGVGDFAVGDGVYGAVPPTTGGGYAESVIVPSATLADKPKNLSFVEAASVPSVAITAWQSLFESGGLTAGQTVLIHGGSGGVGMFAVQLAHQKGARVIATCSAENIEFVESLGADEVLDYKAVRFEEKVSGVDVVLDTQGGDTQERSWQTLKPGGILVSVVSPPSEEKAAEANARGVMVQVAASKALLTEIAEMLDAGTIKTEIAQTFSLSEARQAQELSQIGHTRGKIVLQIA